MSLDIGQQYLIIDKALQRIKQVLHINDSFLGQAFASDSGKKVSLQKGSAMMALRYLTTKLDILYRTIGLDLLSLMRQYMTAQFEVDQTEDITQKVNWTKLNQPIMMLDDSGQEQPAYEMIMGKKGPEKRLMNDPDYSLMFDRLDIKLQSVSYEDATDADKLLIQGTLDSGAGQMLAQTQPGHYFMIASLLASQTKTIHSAEIAAIFKSVGISLGAAPTLDPRQAGPGDQSGANAPQPNAKSNTGQVASAMGVDTNTMYK